MSTEFLPDPGLTLILSLDQNTRQIDQTFATAGDRLGQGLAILETLNDRLGAMSSELVGSTMDGTRDALLAVVGDLRAFSASLPEEARRLQDIARHCDAGSQSFDRLLDNIRLILAVARSARIEAAQSGRHGGDYFDEIGVLVALAKQTIETCAHNHDRLKGMLVAALASQRDFAASYGATLVTLAGQLEDTLGHIEARRRRSVVLTADAAEQSRKIADAASDAIIALQCGDSTRQRVEHSIFALRLAQDVASGTCPDADGLSYDDRAALGAVLRQLVASQLQAAATTMTKDVRDIGLALRVLEADMAKAAALGRSLYGGDDPGASSFLAVLEDQLSQASGLVGKCSAARVQVDQVSDALMTFVDQFRQTAVSLSETVCNIVLIGVNSGLHAARLGNDGRGLVVIAHELKAAADHIVANAGQLSPIFDLMQAATVEMKAVEAGRAAQLATLDGTMRQSLGSMKASSSRLQATLDEFAKDSTTFAAAVEDTRRSFSVADGTADMIANIARTLQAGPSNLPIDDHAKFEAVLGQTIWPTYTMAAERELHLTTLEAAGLSADMALDSAAESSISRAKSSGSEAPAPP